MGFVVVLGACTKDWEEMNTNPNQPVTVPPTNILAYSLRYIADNFFDDWMSMNNTGSYAGHIAKIQYIDESRYEEREIVVNEAWRDMYTTLGSLNKAIALSKEEDNTNLEAACMTFQVFIFQMATDFWKDVPYSDALKAESGVTNPKYDAQQDIYYGMLQTLKNAGDMFAGGTGEVGEGDLLFDNDASKWQKFCNSLRLRLAIRISNVDPATAKQHIEEVLGDPATYPIMSGNADNAFFWWPGAAPYKEPWMEVSETRDDHGMCITIVDTLKAFNDPRLPVYAHPATSDGVYRGLIAGALDGSFVLADISRIGTRFRDDPTGFSPFMRYSEVLFIIAEAAKNGWNTGMTAQAAYEAGVTASLEENGIAAGDITTYLADPKVAWQDSYTQIYIQKWIALFKQSHEAWAETRRTDVPKMSEAPGSPYVGNHDRPPFRYPYPTDEYNLNGSNLSPHTTGIVNLFWGQQMWWDTRTGIQ
jgi:hypothetical protein